MFDSIIALAQSVVALATSSIPSDQERLERMRAKYPKLVAMAEKQAQEAKIKTIKKKLRQLKIIQREVEKNNLPVNDLTLYLTGDTTEAELIKKIIETKNKSQ